MKSSTFQKNLSTFEEEELNSGTFHFMVMELHLWSVTTIATEEFHLALFGKHLLNAPQAAPKNCRMNDFHHTHQLVKS